MAVLETIRVKFGVLITVLIAIALLSFIVDFNSLSSAVQSSSTKYTVGKVNGNKVSYKDFQEQVEYQTGIAEIINRSSASTDQQQQQIRNAAWQHFVDRFLFFKKAQAAGISVGTAELKDITVGDMISPVIAYDPVFGSPNGNVNTDDIISFVKNMKADNTGNSRKYWNYVQENVLTQQYYAKYGNLFAATNIDSKLTAANAISENNVSANADVVMVPFGYQKDSTITVSSSEISKYYKAHKDNYKQVANRDIEYALFEVVPSEDDHAAARKAVEDVYDEFVATDNVKNFLMRNSETPLNNYWYKAGELNTFSTEVNDFVFSGATGASPVFKKDNSYCTVKVVQTKNIPDSVYVRHILIQGNNNLADSLFNVIKADKSQFSSIAAVYSADQNPNVAVPGDLGWMTQSYMFPGMESVLTADVNTPFIIDTQYGRHIVEVTKATKPVAKKMVAILQKTAVPSKATMNDYYNKANTLATTAAGKLDAFENAAKEQNVYLIPTNVTEATARYSSVDRAKEVTRWIFEAKKGAVSNVITVNQNYLFVVGVKGIHKEGYAKVDEVKGGIETEIYNQKYGDKILAEVSDKIKDCTTIEEVAKALDKEVMTKENVTFASLNSPDCEPALLGAIAGAQEGVVTRPVKGEIGVYVVCVKDRTTGSFYTEDDAKQLQNQKNQYASQMILPVMFESSGSVDHRERFY